MSIYDSLPEIQHGIDGIWSAKIGSSPATVNDPVMVTIPAFDDHFHLGPCAWVTKGTSLPQIGQDCLVAYDELQRPIVIAWWDGTGGVLPIPLVTSLPGSPYDTQECYFQNTAMATAGILWHLRYRAASASSYKWECVSAPTPLYSLVATNENINNVGYVAMGIAGPSIALPLAGDYDVNQGFYMNNAVNGVTGRMSYDIGATGAVDADAASAYCNTFANDTAYAIRKQRKTGLSAVTLTAKYKTDGSLWFAERWMQVTPVRVI